jgi:hypothetical protein
MKTIIATILSILCLATIGFAQQDPDDLGLQDSLIIGETRVDSGATFAFVQIFAVTDDSVAYYNLPLRWTAPGGGVYPGSGTLYFPPLTSWDDTYDSVLVLEGYVRQFGFSDLGGEDNPVLHTNGVRVNTWNIRFIISPGAPSQLITIDTTYDSNSQSAILGLKDGVHEITPAIVPGYLGIGVAVDEDISGLPDEFTLAQNYPNPFNPTTVIDFTLPRESHVQLSVYDILGKKVKTLVDESKAPGAYSVIWDGTDNGGNPQASGTYFYRLSSDESTLNRRMTLVR